MARSVLSSARHKTSVSFAGTACRDRSVFFLPYGSSDSSVILQHPLTTLPTAAELDVATVTELDSAITFDTNGMLLGANRLRFTTLSNSSAAERAKLDKQGQISFQVQKEMICNDGTSNGSTVNGATSTGDTNAGNVYIFQMRGTAELFIRGNATQNIEVFGTSVTLRRSWFDSASSANPAISTVGKGDYITVNIGWGDGLLIFAVDGVPIVAEAWTGGTALGNFIDWNSRSGAGNVTHTRYIKNVQISNKAPAIPYSTDLGTVVVWGDSQPETYDATSSTAQLDADMGHTIHRKLWANGIYPKRNKIKVVDNGGDAFANHSTGALSANAAASYTTDIVGNAPSTIVWVWGTNDVASDTTFSNANFTTALETFVDNAMALTNTKLLVLMTVGSLIGDAVEYAESQNAQNMIDANAAINAQAARWEAANPSSTKKIVVVDRYTLLGGDTTGNNYWIGEVKASNDFHMTDLAHYIIGNAAGQAIVDNYGVIQGVV